MQTQSETPVVALDPEEQNAPAPALGFGGYSICRRDVLPVHNCQFSHEPITTPWVILLGRRPVSASFIQTGAVLGGIDEEVISYWNWLNAAASELANDDPHIGLLDTRHPSVRQDGICGYSAEKYEVWDVPVLARGRFEISAGLPMGYVHGRLGHWASHMRAGNLARLVDAHYGSAAPAPLYTRAELREQAEAAQRVKAAAARQAQIDDALGGLAIALFGDAGPESCTRAKSAVAAIDAYRKARANSAE